MEVNNDFRIIQEEKKRLYDETVELVNDIYNKYPVGGVLHIVLDDGNIKDNHIKWCMEEANKLEQDRDLFVKCCENLLKMSNKQRYKIYRTT